MRAGVDTILAWGEGIRRGTSAPRLPVHLPAFDAPEGTGVRGIRYLAGRASSEQGMVRLDEWGAGDCHRAES